MHLEEATSYVLVLADLALSLFAVLAVANVKPMLYYEERVL